ncbi:tailspike / hydrolase [Pseudomonas phage Waldo5]|uniref:Tailspike / hydrolase n=1 Tax=Pseudomonas phage Waldo5 TaxID=2762290 RepID=A0A7G8LJQ6_9CAUD|nr:tailspike / hydrolase [Pseudomonas phage Waldo5]
MANTISTYQLDGTQRVFDIGFEYLARRFIVVTLINGDTRQVLGDGEYRFVTPTQISTTIAWGPGNGFETIELRRRTSATDRVVSFADGDVLRANDLNVAQIQAIHIAEEAQQIYNDTASVNSTGQLDARNRRIINVRDGVNPKDAVNMDQLAGEEAKMTVLLGQAAQQATNSANSALRAEGAARAAAATIGDRLNPLNPEYGGKGNGVDNDTAAFVKFEAIYVGRTVDLGGAICKVDYIPRKNVYINGGWKLSGVPNDFTRIAYEGDTVLARPACFTPYGGGLNRLRAALLDIMTQFVGIVWIGDSITWGSGNQPETSPTDPRNGTLKDPRDWFGTNSYVNNLRRYIIEEYLPGATITTAQWPLSPYGEAIVIAKKDITILPLGEDFPTKVIGSSISITNDAAVSLPTKWRMLISNANVADGQNGYGEFSFKFTGDTFRLHLGCVDATASDYIVYVDGNSIGRFSTNAGAPIDNGQVLVEGTHGTRTHTFPMIYKGTITIRAVRPLVEAGDTTKVLRIGGLIIPKTLRLTNNGINGSTLTTYRIYNMPPSGYGYSGSVAVNMGDWFTFIQLGTNDRGNNRGPQAIPFIKQEAKALLATIPYHCVPILMVSNPAIPVPGANLDQSDIRMALATVARERALDFIDNYGAFRGLDRLAFAKDQLHPNQWGYSVVSANIIKAIESSIDAAVVPPPPPVPTYAISPFDTRFVVTAPAGTQIIDRDAAPAYLGKQRLYRIGPTNSGDIKFRFNVTGKDFALVFSSLDVNILNYELLVDGVSKGTFSTRYLEEGGGTQVYQNVRWHTISDTGGAHVVDIVGKRRTEWPDVTQVLYLEAVLYKEGVTIS